MPEPIIELHPVANPTIIELHKEEGPKGDPGPAVDDEILADLVADYLEENPPDSQDPRLDTHIVDDTPHPAYDDLPSLTLLFENGLV